MTKQQYYTMKSKKRFLVVFICLISFVFTGSVPERGLTFDKSYEMWPDELQNIKLGMTMDKFYLHRNDLCIEVFTELDFRIELTEKLNHKSIREIHYYFTQEVNPLLYQIVVSYNSKKALQDYLLRNLGIKNPGDEWAPAENIKAWSYQQKLVMVSPIEGSEWAI